jgi:hypothetical protein
MINPPKSINNFMIRAVVLPKLDSHFKMVNSNPTRLKSMDKKPKANKTYPMVVSIPLFTSNV